MAIPNNRNIDLLRRRVFLGIAKGIAWFSLATAVLEAIVRGPFAAITFLNIIESSLFWTLYFVSKRTNRSAQAAIVGFAFIAVLMMWVQRKYPHAHSVCNLCLFCIPMVITLISGRRAGVGFLVAASVNEAYYVIWSGRALLGPGGVALICCLFVGFVVLMLVSIFDTERLKAEKLAIQREQELLSAVDRAEHAAASRLQFLANMSHEVRTPMNGVLGLSRLLVDEPMEPQAKDLAHTILECGQGLLHILDDILDLSKLDAGAIQVDARPTQPTVIGTQVVRLMSGKALESGLELKLEVSKKIPEWVMVDGHRVRQVLNNLTGNAIKFTQRGSVSLATQYKDGQLIFSVRDTGIGMNEATVARIFSPFEQADASTARRYGGTGLGLAISKKLCELMDGDISCTSEVGKGSTFVAFVDAPVCDAPSDYRASTSPDNSFNLKVLVAEDMPINQLVIRRILEKMGIKPQLVASGLEAVQAVKSEEFDLILMDLQMPEMGGIEATKCIRKLDGKGAQTPVAALTASVMAKEREACIAAGMIEILSKPIDLDSLRALLEKVHIDVNNGTRSSVNT